MSIATDLLKTDHDLNHAQMHDALSYYYDNKEEIGRFIEKNTAGTFWNYNL